MIEILFEFGTEAILIRIDGNSVRFSNTLFGNVMADIKGIRLSREGVIKEFPDLKESEDWKEEAINRFTEKIKGCATEKEKADYIVEDLRKFGYIPKFLQKKGYRRRVIR